MAIFYNHPNGHHYVDVINACLTKIFFSSLSFKRHYVLTIASCQTGIKTLDLLVKGVFIASI